MIRDLDQGGDDGFVRNVLGGPLQPCCFQPMTGYFRDGYCKTCKEDVGSHTVCIKVTAEFLAFSKNAGNDLSTPVPQFHFAGLKPGDRWCLCAARWLEACEHGMAPKVVLEASNAAALDIIPLELLKAHAA